jgi:hypothetical protein
MTMMREAFEPKVRDRFRFAPAPCSCELGAGRQGGQEADDQGRAHGFDGRHLYGISTANVSSGTFESLICR